ncbi:unnamed protein product [Penicillium glandicola]
MPQATTWGNLTLITASAVAEAEAAAIQEVAVARVALTRARDLRDHIYRLQQATGDTEAAAV